MTYPSRNRIQSPSLQLYLPIMTTLKSLCTSDLDPLRRIRPEQDSCFCSFRHTCNDHGFFDLSWSDELFLIRRNDSVMSIVSRTSSEEVFKIDCVWEFYFLRSFYKDFLLRWLRKFSHLLFLWLRKYVISYDSNGRIAVEQRVFTARIDWSWWDIWTSTAQACELEWASATTSLRFNSRMKSRIWTDILIWSQLFTTEKLSWSYAKFIFTNRWR